MNNLSEKLNQAMAILKENGLKLTKRRKEILSFLIEENRYLSALDVFEFMSERYQGMSYDTVYRNLRDFSDLNLLEETEFHGEKKYRFSCNVNQDHHHHHFICTVCGATKEINICPMDMFKEQLPGCVIEGHRFEIFGKCENC